MKKLMIAAALAAAMIGSASADCNDPCGPKCIWGYKLMLVAKTTVGGVVSNSYAKTCDSCYRKPTMGKIYGYWFGHTLGGGGTCGDACGCNDFTAEDQNFLLWKAWNKQPLLAELDENTFGAFKQLDRIGYKDRSTVEMCWSFTFDDPKAYAEDKTITPYTGATLTLAGFGKAAHRADGSIAIKSANGYFAGQMLDYCPGAVGPCGDEGAWEASQYWAICGTDDFGTQVSNDPLTAAYGKWQMVWDPQLVDRLTKKGWSQYNARPSTAYDLNPNYKDASIVE